MKVNSVNITRINNDKINLFVLNPSKDFAWNKNQSYGLRLTKPLAQDTVSFQSKVKKIQKVVSKEIEAAMARQQARELRYLKQLEEANTEPTKKKLASDERTWGISKSTAAKIHSMVIYPQERIHDFMLRIFGDLKVSEIFPDNLLLDIADRAKSIISIMEKSATRKWNSIKEILQNMTDLNGAKLVMNYKTGKAETESVLSRLIPLIKTENPIIRIKEIEIQRPKAIEKLSLAEQEEFDYVSKAFLDKLEDAQEEVINGLETDVNKIVLIDRPLPKYTKGNYCALHIIMELTEKDSRPFELQIMGPREAQGKELNDMEFKFFNGKLVDKIYSPLTDSWQRLLAEENAPMKERYLQYSKDAMFDLRLRELQEHKTQKVAKKGTNIFKSIQKYTLTPEYEWDRQYKIKKECDQKLSNLEKAREAKKEKAQQIEPEHTGFNFKRRVSSSIKKVINRFKPNKPKLKKHN